MGGTRRLFELAVLPTNRFRSRVADAFGHAPTIEQIPNAESMVKVTYDGGTESLYDYEGNLQKVIVPMAAYFLGLDEETLGQLDKQMLQAMAKILKLETELTMEIDLADGIKEGDGSGWVQLIMGPNGMEKMSAGLGGFEIGPGMTMEPYSISVQDSKGGEMTRVYFRVEIRGNELYLALGDEKGMLASKFSRRINPDLVNNISKPTGAVRFLASLRS